MPFTSTVIAGTAIAGSAASAASLAAAGTTMAAVYGSAIAIDLAVVGGGMAVLGEMKAGETQAEYMRRSYASQQEAVSAENRMIRDQETLEKKKAINQARLIASRIRVTAGESGLGFGGTYEALLRQSDYDTAINLGIIGQNAQNQFASAAGKMQPINSREYNPLFAGLSAGIGGYATGLSLGDSLTRKRIA